MLPSGSSFLRLVRLKRTRQARVHARSQAFSFLRMVERSLGVLRVPAVRGFEYVFEFRGEGQGDPETGKNDAADGRCTRGCRAFKKKKVSVMRRKEGGREVSREVLCSFFAVELCCICSVLHMLCFR